MSGQPFRLVRLSPEHERTTFSSASEPLNRYIREQVTQDIRRRITTCYVALTDDNRIAAYYTLSAAHLDLSDLPASTQRKLPRYPTVPAIRLGRLAVDRSFERQGLGGALLADALHRAIQCEIAVYALVVDAKDEPSQAFYRHHGFMSLPDSPLTLFLPLKSAEALL